MKHRSTTTPPRRQQTLLEKELERRQQDGVIPPFIGMTTMKVISVLWVVIGFAILQLTPDPQPMPWSMILTKLLGWYLLGFGGFFVVFDHFDRSRIDKRQSLS